MVQSIAWFRLPDARRRDAGHLRPHGNAAPVRPDGTAPRPVRPGALWTGPEGHDGGRSSPRGRRRPYLALAARAACLASALPWAARFAAALLVGAYVAFAFPAPVQAAQQDTLEIVSASGVHAFAVEVVADDAERERGLMFRRELPEGKGMLFDFQHDQPVAFWMHNTYISLDMIFIGSDGRIRRIAENTKPLSDRSIPSGVPVRAVLEVIAGTARKLGILPGN